MYFVTFHPTLWDRLTEVTQLEKLCADCRVLSCQAPDSGNNVMLALAVSIFQTACMMI